MEWKDLLDIASLNYFADSVDNDIDTELRQQVQKTLFDNVMKTKTLQEKKETKKRRYIKLAAVGKLGRINNVSVETREGII